MATLALSAVGSALGGPIGGIVGGFLGSLIDQQIMALFQDPIKGPRIDELRIPSFDEGSACPWVLGAQNRVPGQIIWVSKMREAKSTSGGKGGGGGGAKTVTYDYYIDVAVAFLRQTTRTTTPIRKMWANGLMVFERGNRYDVSSTAITVAKFTEKKTFGYSVSCTDKADKEYIDYIHYGSAINIFSKIRSGENVTISGCANANNNGTFSVFSVTNNYGGVFGKSAIRVFRCAHAWTKSSTLWSSTCTDNNSSCAAGVDEAAGASIRVEQVGQDDFNKSLIETVTQYNGSSTQGVDPIMVAAEGTGNVPAYRGTTYVLIKNLKVNQWGGTIPGFEALVEESSSKLVSQAILDIATRNRKLTVDDIDVTGVTGSMLGMAILGAKAPSESLKAIMLVYDIEVQARSVIESGVFKCKLFFFNKQSAVERTIDDDDRGAQAAGDEEVDLVKITQTDPQELPNEVMIQFIDPTREWQPGSRGYKKVISTIDNQSRISVAMTLSPSSAIAVAKKVVWSMNVNERIRVELVLPPTYIDLAEADLIIVNDNDGKPIKARVTKIDRGNNGLLIVEALQETVTLYTEPATGESVPG